MKAEIFSITFQDLRERLTLKYLLDNWAVNYDYRKHDEDEMVKNYEDLIAAERENSIKISDAIAEKVQMEKEKLEEKMTGKRKEK